jgi:signal transduction histidine kinase
VAASTDKSDLGTHYSNCLLAHDLLNKLTVVLGNCELLKEEAPEGSARLKRLLLIRDVAASMAESIKKHHCDLDAVMRSADPPQRLSVNAVANL